MSSNRGLLLSSLTQKQKEIGGIALCLVLGTLLRLIFGNDIEYKYDEQVMFQQSLTRGFWESLFSPGMLSGVLIPNPGLSAAIFVALKKIFGATTPPELARAVQILNVIALWILGAFALFRVEKQERESWLWGTALVAVNPLAILFHRKIWAQSVLPIFCMVMILGWASRNRRWGAFVWGFFGACLGQIHMSGFFLAAAVFIWTALKKEKVQWTSWVIGSAIAAVPLIPWLREVLNTPSQTAYFNLDDRALVENFWLLWITDSLGLDLFYSLKKNEFLEFLKYPYIFQIPTFIVAFLHLGALWIGLKILTPAARTFWENKNHWQKVLFGNERGSLGSSGSALSLQKASFWGCGVFLHLTGKRVCRHYLIVTFPFAWVWISRLALARPDLRKLLPILFGIQLGLSVSFLYYIHVNHGAPSGDYGVTYGRQLELLLQRK